VKGECPQAGKNDWTGANFWPMNRIPAKGWIPTGQPRAKKENLETLWPEAIREKMRLDQPQC
jgi:hypothetical protein